MRNSINESRIHCTCKGRCCSSCTTESVFKVNWNKVKAEVTEVNSNPCKVLLKYQVVRIFVLISEVHLYMYIVMGPQLTVLIIEVSLFQSFHNSRLDCTHTH